MNKDFEEFQMNLLAQELNELRDLWVQVSLHLKDYVAEIPSTANKAAVEEFRTFSEKVLKN